MDQKANVFMSLHQPYNKLVRIFHGNFLTAKSAKGSQSSRKEFLYSACILLKSHLWRYSAPHADIYTGKYNSNMTTRFIKPFSPAPSPNRIHHEVSNSCQESEGLYKSSLYLRLEGDALNSPCSIVERSSRKICGEEQVALIKGELADRLFARL